MASIEPRGDSIRVSWRLGGGRDGARQSCTFSGGTVTAREKTAATAKALVESRDHNMTRADLYDAILGVPDEPTRDVPTFKAHAAAWIETLRGRRDLDPGSVDEYARCLRLRAVPFLGHLQLTSIDRDVIRAWVAWVNANQVTAGARNMRGGAWRISATTVRQNFGVVSMCLGAAVPMWLPLNPAARLPGENKNFAGLPKAERFHGMFLAPNEVRLILDECDDHIRDLVVLALRTGMRVGELMALTSRHVVFPRAGGATVLVRETVKKNGTVGVPKSDAGNRDLPVKGLPAEILARRVRGLKPSGLVFPAPHGGRWEATVLRRNHWYRAVGTAMRCADHLPDGVRARAAAIDKNGLVSTCDCPGVLTRRPRFHDLRHTHASVLIDEGWHARKIQGRLGHANWTTTMRTYGHLMDNGRDDELDGMEGWFAG